MKSKLAMRLSGAWINYSFTKQPAGSGDSRIAQRFALKPLAFALVAASLIAQPLPGLANCTPGGTNIADLISCSAGDTQGVNARAGDDTVTVQSGANVTLSGGSPVPVIAINAGAGDDTVTNLGSVSAAASTSQTNSPSPPSLSPGIHVTTTDNLVSANAVGIAGSSGNDTLDNRNTVSVTAVTEATNVSMPLTVSGGDTVTSTTTIEANATGISGGTGSSTVINGASLGATASAQISSINVEHNLIDGSHGNASTTLTAIAIGLLGGNDANSVTRNTGTISTDASAHSLGVSVEMNMVDAATADASLTVQSNATGVKAGNGGGIIDNSGAIGANASSSVLDVGVNASYLDVTISDRKVSNASTTVDASATGIDAAPAVGDVTITHSGTINATAHSMVTAVAISLASEGVPASTETLFKNLVNETGIASIGIIANTFANGIVGGSGNDRIDSSGIVNVTASSHALQDSINVGISLIDWKVPTPGIVLGSAGTGANASATGLDGGAGNDTISNTNHIHAIADATASAVTVSANISGFSDNSLGGGSIPVLGALSASLAVADTTTAASATATGMQGGGGSDTLGNSGIVESNAVSTAGSISVSASVNVKYKEGENLFSANAVAARSVSKSDATATGLDGGDGADNVTNSGVVNVDANATSKNVAVAIAVAGSVRGAGGALNLSATDTRGLATGLATGIQGGAGNDTMLNASTGTIQAASHADAGSVGVGVSIGFAKQGLVVDAALSRSESIATATSVGIDGGAGNDSIRNEGAIATTADATAKAIAVSVGISGTADGLSIAAALAKADAQANATATGIDGGADDDTVTNAHSITSQNVQATASAASVSVSLAGTNNGVAAGFSLANASANATSLAQGIQGGSGNDTLTNSSSIVLQQIDADANAVSVAVTLTAAVNAGVAAGVAMTDTSAHATTIAIGMDGGDGNDVLTNSGSITASDIHADTSAVSVAISANLSMAGVAAGAAFSDASATATTTVKGMSGGAGDDTMRNSGIINVHGNADVAASSVGITINAALGVGGGAQIVNAGSTATTTAMGIDGGTGRNDIVNSGAITANAEADAQALTVAVGVTLAFGGDATLADAKTTAMATAVGINNEGDAAQAKPGTIANTATVTVSADAASHGTSISGNLRGFALGDTTNSATANAFGIRNGDGASVIGNAGALSVTGTADASGLAISATLFGKAMGNADTIADARATGIGTGSGSDQIENAAAITATAISTAGAITLAIDLAGSTDTDLRTESLATARGIYAGDGTNTLINRSSIIAHADAGTTAAGVSISLAGTAHADATTSAVATALGMGGGSGNDAITHLGSLDVSAVSHSDVFNVSWTLLGTNGNEAGTSAQATATGLDGGAGADTILNHSTLLRVNASSQTTLNSSSWAMAGTANDNGTLDAISRATGIDGGVGSDSLRNETAITVGASASLFATGGSNTIFGGASANTKVGAEAYATGLNGGDGDDTITNLGAISVSATSTVVSTKASFSFAGNANIDELLKSTSRATGIDGGNGNNIIYSDAAITVNSNAAATTNGSARALLGGGTSATGSAVADAGATGILTGVGDDQIENRGAITVTATIAPQTNNSSSAGVFFGSGQVQGSIVGTLNAAGIDAGDGNNLIINRGSIVANAFTLQNGTSVTATANTYASGSDFSFLTGGSGNAYSSTYFEADAAGIRAGNGNNNVVNSGSIAVHIDQTLAAAYTDPNGGSTSGSGNGTSEATAIARGAGIQLGDGNNIVLSSGTIDVIASPKASATSDADGTGLDNANATVTGSSYAEAAGIRLGNGSNQIVSNAAIHVTATPLAESRADVDGGHTGGDGNGYANNLATAKATGLSVGDGNGHIENNALLSVVANPNARAYNNDVNVYSDGYSNGDAVANVYSQSMAEAVGISTGNGAHAIINTGAIVVNADAVATVGWRVDGGSGPQGHSYATVSAYAEGRATGIQLGGGDTTIVSTGDITVSARPTSALANTIGDGGPYIKLETFGVAYGINDTRSAGNVSVTNSGHITVNASSTISIVDDGSVQDPSSSRLGGAPAATGIILNTAGHKEVVNNGSIVVNAAASGPILDPDPTQNAFATAVQATGSSNTVVNNGTITATTTVNGVTTPAYAIFMGTFIGTNVLSLGPTSVTNGNVTIYQGSTTLILEGNPILNGTLSKNPSDSFSLVLNNAGSFTHTLPTVLDATKNGSGTYTLPVLNTLRNVTVNQGTLELGSNYAFSNGLYQTSIYADGRNGRVAIDGTATLAGNLKVVRGDGLYRQGMTFDVLTASGGIASGSTFSHVELPASTALVTFHEQQLADRVRIGTDVASFEKFSGTGNQGAIATYLDGIMQGGSEKFTPMLEAMQGLSDGKQVAAAFDSFNPLTYASGPTLALKSNQRFSNAMLSCRVRDGDNRFVQEGECSWGRVMGRMTKSDATANSASTDEDALEISAGVQKAINENWFAGFGLSYEDSKLTSADSSTSDGNRYQAGAILKAVYGNATYSLSFSGGQGLYDTRRPVNFPVAGLVATGDQKIGFLSSHLRAGYAFEQRDWYLRPLLDVGVTHTRMGAFSESGAGAANLDVQKQTETYVTVQPMLEIGTEWTQPGGTLWRPYAAIGATRYLGGSDPQVTAMFQGAPVGVMPFTVKGDMDRTFANLNLGVDFIAVDGKDIRVSYEGQFSDNTTSHAFALKFSVPF
jgi:uncharacterized protein YhjY with autotransporter beta-barrel domain